MDFIPNRFNYVEDFLLDQAILTFPLLIRFNQSNKIEPFLSFEL